MVEPANNAFRRRVTWAGLCDAYYCDSMSEAAGASASRVPSVAAVLLWLDAYHSTRMPSPPEIIPVQEV